MYALLALGSATPAFTESAALTILHTNDTHGHLLPFSYPGQAPAGSAIAQLSARRDIGGIARRATLVKRIRAEQAAKGTPVWLVDAGDFSDGTPFSTEYHGEADIAAMNAAGYDFATLGNHELNNSLAQVRRLLTLPRYKVLCANLRDQASAQPLAQTHTVVNVGSLRVGVFGLLTRDAATYPAAQEGALVDDEIESARRMAALLREQADVIVLLSHCGEAMDEKIAAAVPEIDVIVGGHSHSRLPVGEVVWHSNELSSAKVNGTLIVQAHQWAGELGRLDLLFEKDTSGRWGVARYRARLLSVTAELPADTEVAAVVDRYWRPLAVRFGEVMGTALADFTARGDDRAEYNLVADALRETTGAEIALDNMGGVRAPLVKGPITRADLVAMDPFQNSVVTFKLSGRAIKQLLARAQPAVSGLRYRIENGRLLEATVAGRPLRDARMYTVCSHTYFIKTYLQDTPVRDTGRLRIDVLTDYVRKQGSLSPAYDSRRVVIEP